MNDIIRNSVDKITNIDLEAVLAFLLSDDLQFKLLAVKIAFMAASAALVGLIIFLMSKTHYWDWLYLQDVNQFFTMRSFGGKKISRQWVKTLERLEKGLEPDYKLAVIEADELLDSSLKKMGYEGQTLEERLGKIPSTTLPNVDQVTEVHSLRNSIVHDPNFRLTADQAKDAMNVYEQAFRNLQILE